MGIPITGTGRLVSGLGGTAGFGETEAARNDDGSTFIADISSVFENGISFAGRTFTSLYLNTNGSISFGTSIGQYTPSTISAGSVPMIAPFWADVDTRIPATVGTNSGAIYLDLDPVSDVLTATWPGVNYFDFNGDKKNSFQLQLYDRGAGNFDIVFRYQDIQWTTGDASSGTGGLGGTPARAGFTAGDRTTYFELSQSGNQAALLALDSTPGNTGTQGLWVFEVRNGEVQLPTSDIFGQRGKLAFLAELARGAYHLRNDANLGDGIDSNETPGFGFSEDPKADDSFNVANQFLDLLDPADFGAAWEGPLGLNEDFFGYVNGLENGIFTSVNAGALVARSNDALFVAFRGSNDTLDFLDDATNSGRASHWDEFANLRAAITAYVNDAANGITKVYVTGHSLGGAMVQAMMAEHAGDARYEAATFGSIGYGSGADSTDARIVNMANDGDPATQFPIVSRNNGDMNVVVDQLPYGTTAHSMSLYYEIARFLHSEGYDFEFLMGASGFDFDSIALGAHVLSGNAFSVGNLAEVVVGSEVADLVLGGVGNDTLAGLGGNDLAVGGTGDDMLFGGSGDDTLDGGAGSDGLFGDIGADVFFGGVGIDFALAGAGNDLAYGGSERDLLYGEAGLDVLFGEGGDDFLAGGADRDWLYAGTGFDVLFGGDGDDVMSGDLDRDWVYGEAGRDLLFGGDGDDVVAGGAGADTVIGGTGADALFGETGDDFIFAEDGNDFVVGGAGYNQISLAGGLDIVLSTNGDAGTQYVVDFSVADGDQLWLVGSGFASAAAALASAVNVGGATYIGNGNDAIYLAGIAPSQLSAANIVLL